MVWVIWWDTVGVESMIIMNNDRLVKYLRIGSLRGRQFDIIIVKRNRGSGFVEVVKYGTAISLPSGG